MSSFKTIFYIELKNIRKTVITNDFSNPIVDEQIKRAIKNINSNCNGNNATSETTNINYFSEPRFTNTTNSMK